MVPNTVLESALKEALKTGADFAEIFVEDTTRTTLHHIDGKMDSAVQGRDYGAGIRIFKGFQSIYAYTNDVSLGGLCDTAKKAAVALNDRESYAQFDLHSQLIHNLHPIMMLPTSVDSLKKAGIVREAYMAAKSYHSEIRQVSITYGDVVQNILIANSEGKRWADQRVRTRVAIQVVAENTNGTQTGFAGPGRSQGFEMFHTVNIAEHAIEASRSAHTMLYAPECPAGIFPVVIDSGFGGVIFHEACGHALEATSVAKGNSIFADKLGQQIASTKVTAIDDGTIPNAWGSTNIDDEGTPTGRLVLIENGILKNYMVDKLNARRMNQPITGNSRRQSYKLAPTSRMTNTYIAEGTDENCKIIASMQDGLYAKKMGGGSVNPITGEFNFAVSEGYLVKNGEITTPVRGATLIGKGAEVLLNIDMVGKDMALGQGMCGSLSGSVPTNVGQPMIRVSKMTVGGRK